MDDSPPPPDGAAMHPIGETIFELIEKGTGEKYAFLPASVKAIGGALASIHEVEEMRDAVVALATVAEFFETQHQSPGVSQALIGVIEGFAHTLEARGLIPDSLDSSGPLDRISAFLAQGSGSKKLTEKSAGRRDLGTRLSHEKA